MAHCTSSFVTLQTNDPSPDHASNHVEHLTDHVEHLTDHELLASTQQLVGRSNQVFAALLAHLAEVEARGVHRTRACASLYTYCIYVLRFSEDAAFRRVAAARLVKRFPVLLGVIERGELHLTGLLMLGPHLTLENHLEVLARAKHRTKKEIARLVRVLSPLPSVPARIEPLGPAPARRAALNPSWEMVTELPVRHLAPRERPAGWTVGDPSHEDDPNYADGTTCGQDRERHGDRALADGVGGAALARRECGREERKASTDAVGELARETLATEARETLLRQSELLGSGRMDPPERYLVQFTATEEYVKLCEEAKALLSHAPGERTIEAIHLRAMRALVADLKKRKYGVTPRTQRSAGEEKPEIEENREGLESQKAEENREDLDCQPLAPTARSCEAGRGTGRNDGEAAGALLPVTSRRRYLKAAVRREVFERDEGCCTYSDECGRRCCEKSRLEIHHVEPFARGGPDDVSNLALRCREHNQLAAEQDFGRAFMAHQRDTLEHDPMHENVKRRLMVSPAKGPLRNK